MNELLNVVNDGFVLADSINRLFSTINRYRKTFETCSPSHNYDDDIIN